MTPSAIEPWLRNQDSCLSIHRWAILLQWPRNKEITATGAQGISLSLKVVKVQCLQKGMMNVHYPFIMYEFTNCFRTLCSVTRRSWIFEKPWEWKSTLVSSPHIIHTRLGREERFSDPVLDNLPLLFVMCHLIWGFRSRERNPRARSQLKPMVPPLPCFMSGLPKTTYHLKGIVHWKYFWTWQSYYAH